MSTKEHRQRIELLQGTLGLLILRILPPGPARGDAIAQGDRISLRRGAPGRAGFAVPRASPAIKRGWISGQEGSSENNRRAKSYRLTNKGRRQLQIETSKWDKLAGAIARILQPAEQEDQA